MFATTDGIEGLVVARDHQVTVGDIRVQDLTVGVGLRGDTAEGKDKFVVHLIELLLINLEPSYHSNYYLFGSQVTMVMFNPLVVLIHAHHLGGDIDDAAVHQCLTGRDTLAIE